MGEANTVTCTVCYGTKTRRGQPCPACGGTGKIEVPPRPTARDLRVPTAGRLANQYATEPFGRWKGGAPVKHAECPPRGGRGPRPRLVEILDPRGVVQGRHREGAEALDLLAQCHAQGYCRHWQTRLVPEWNGFPRERYPVVPRAEGGPTAPADATSLYARVAALVGRPAGAPLEEVRA